MDKYIETIDNTTIELLIAKYENTITITKADMIRLQALGHNVDYMKSTIDTLKLVVEDLKTYESQNK